MQQYGMVYETAHHFPTVMFFKTYMTKGDILKNVQAALFHTIIVNGK